MTGKTGIHERTPAVFAELHSNAFTNTDVSIPVIGRENQLRSERVVFAYLYQRVNKSKV
jgi:hypothetical protein